MERNKNLCQPPEYTADMVKDIYKQEVARALRLRTIQDILGDDYDLDRLRELVEADRDGRVQIEPPKTNVTNGEPLGKYSWLMGRFMR